MINPSIGLRRAYATRSNSSVVSLPAILRLYLIIPAVAAVIVVDLMVLGGRLAEILRRSPQDYLLLSLLFGTPHIVASNIILFTNADYLSHYRWQLLKISAAIGAFFLVFGFWLPYEIMFALIAGWTVMHVVKQQLGIGNIVARSSGRTYQLWIAMGIGAGVAYYNAIFLQNYLGEATISLLGGLAALLASVTAALTLVLWNECETAAGRLWILANGATMVGSVLMFLAGYGLFAILVPRFLHDVTAFAFYISHDQNRSLAGKRNWLYRFSSRSAWWWLGLPVVAIAVSAGLEHGADSAINNLLNWTFGVTVDRPISLGLVGFLALLHYSFESFTWKGDSPYRAYVKLET